MSQFEEMHTNWMIAATVGSLNEAMIMVGHLRSVDIPCTIQQESSTAALGIGLGTMVKVLVPEEYYDQALETLFPEDESAEFEEGDDEYWEEDEEEYEDDEEDINAKNDEHDDQ